MIIEKGQSENSGDSLKSEKLNDQYFTAKKSLNIKIDVQSSNKFATKTKQTKTKKN